MFLCDIRRQLNLPEVLEDVLPLIGKASSALTGGGPRHLNSCVVVKNLRVFEAT